VTGWSEEAVGAADILALVSGGEALGIAGSLVVPGDNDGGGQPDLAIGSSAADRVYLFRGGDGLYGSMSATGATWVFEGDSGSLFGYGLLTDSDPNGDGLDDVAIGAYAASTDTLSGAGRVYLYDALPASGGSLSTADASLTVQGESDDEHLGTGLAGGADFDGDGVEDLVLGASGWSSGAGRVCIVPGR